MAGSPETGRPSGPIAAEARWEASALLTIALAARAGRPGAASGGREAGRGLDALDLLEMVGIVACLEEPPLAEVQLA